MSLNLRWLRNLTAVPLLCLIIGFASPASAQRASKRSGTVPSETSTFAQPQLLNAATDPTLRYPIGSLVGSLCASMAYGWLDISRTSAHFKVVQPLKRVNEGFEIRPGEISDIKIWQQAIRFRGGSKKYTIYYAPPDLWGSIRDCPAFWDVAGMGQRGTASIQEAFTNFDSVLAQVKAASAPPPPVAAPTAITPAVTTPEPKPAPSAAPAILLIAPSVTGSNQVVDTNESPMTLRGFAWTPRGSPSSRSMAHPPTCGRRAIGPRISGLNRCPFSRAETPLRSSPPMRPMWKRNLPFWSAIPPGPLPCPPKGLASRILSPCCTAKCPARASRIWSRSGASSFPPRMPT